MVPLRQSAAPLSTHVLAREGCPVCLRRRAAAQYPARSGGAAAEGWRAGDLWGDAVNVPARMEDHGTPGQSLTTEAAVRLLPVRFQVVPDGTRDIKGKGPTKVCAVCVAQ